MHSVNYNKSVKRQPVLLPAVSVLGTCETFKDFYESVEITHKNPLQLVLPDNSYLMVLLEVMTCLRQKYTVEYEHKENASTGQVNVMVYAHTRDFAGAYFSIGKLLTDAGVEVMVVNMGTPAPLNG